MHRCKYIDKLYIHAYPVYTYTQSTTCTCTSLYVGVSCNIWFTIYPALLQTKITFSVTLLGVLGKNVWIVLLTCAFMHCPYTKCLDNSGFQIIEVRMVEVTLSVCMYVCMYVCIHVHNAQKVLAGGLFK